MKRSIAAMFAFSVLPGCVQTPRIPATEIKLISIQAEEHLLKAHISANRELTSLFRTYENANQLPPSLICSLDGDRDFSVNHRIKLSASGTVELDQDQARNGRFNYTAILFLVEKSDGGSNYSVDPVQMMQLNALEPSISCKVAITAYGYKAFYSNEIEVSRHLFFDALGRTSH
ncbi:MULTISPECIES: hypothetical protein [unclassified Pseudomonas]|uniref:hypothetical protein n=2 Tax=Pseudomonas TaxID=286 RepID=UPI000CD4BD07|nr:MULTISPECIES: hypothetical protein [unclassified Pseudomonas]